MEQKKEIVWPAEVFDAVEIMAFDKGGIGAGDWFKELPGDLKNDWRSRYDINCPICTNGLAMAAGLHPGSIPDEILKGAECIVNESDLDLVDDTKGVSTSLNDCTIHGLIEEGKFTKDKDGIERVTFEDFVLRLNIVRADD